MAAIDPVTTIAQAIAEGFKFFAQLFDPRLKEISEKLKRLEKLEKCKDEGQKYINKNKELLYIVTDHMLHLALPPDEKKHVRKMIDELHEIAEKFIKYD